MSGLFDIHITVKVSDVFKLRMYCLDNRIKPLMIVSSHGDNSIQMMLSKYKNGTEEEVIERANTMAKELQNKYGCEIMRIKVEAMIGNEGVPEHENDVKNPSKYFEFHIGIPVNSSEEYTRLQNVCHSAGAVLSFNAFKAEFMPIITIRIPGHKGRKNAIEKKNKIMDEIKSHSFHTNDRMHSEFSVYDTNVEFDKGWLDSNHY